mmetsp:Transcript_12072/g.25163  ORF Transcript_12072/g.25163 Transcript_12072/m.25163 type:complete len:273 (+) Transcript_12072:233-1051(+)
MMLVRNTCCFQVLLGLCFCFLLLHVLESFLRVSKGAVKDASRRTLPKNIAIWCIILRTSGIIVRVPLKVILIELLVLRHLLVIFGALQGMKNRQVFCAVRRPRDPSQFVIGELTLGFCRRSGPKLSGGNLRAWRHDRSRRHNGVGLNDGPVENLRRCPDHARAHEGCCVDGGAWPDSDIVANDGREVSLNLSDVDYGAVADGGVIADGDLVHIAPDGGSVPDAGIFPDRDIPNHVCRWGNEGGGFRHRWRDAVDSDKACGRHKALGILRDFD